MNDVGKRKTVNAKESKYINPMIDGGFKLLFGSEKSKELTISLLSSILVFSIEDIVFLNTELLPETLEEKPIRYDILCMDKEHNRYLLEMQVKGHPGLLERTFYYMGRCLSSQLEAGEDYRNLKGVYGIFLMWCGIGDSSEDFIKDYRMVNILKTSEKVDEIRQIFINLRKFGKGKDECVTMMEKWLYNLKNMSRNNEVAFKEREDVFRKLEQYAEEKNLTPDEKLLYDMRVDAWRDYYADLDESMSKGYAKGKIEGKIDVARSLKRLGIPDETIMLATGLTADDIGL